jgi:hypothetical protein
MFFRYLDIDNQNRVFGQMSTDQYFTLEPVPEPQSIVLLATVIVCCGLIYRRKRAAKQA